MWRMARYMTLVVGVSVLTVLGAYTQAFVMIGVGIYTELWVNGHRNVSARDRA